MAVLIHLLWLIHKPINVVSDSAYVVGLFSWIERDCFNFAFTSLCFHFYKNYTWLTCTHSLALLFAHTLASLALLKEMWSWHINLRYALSRKLRRGMHMLSQMDPTIHEGSLFPPAPSHWGQGDSETHQKNSKLPAKGQREISTISSYIKSAHLGWTYSPHIPRRKLLY